MKETSPTVLGEPVVVTNAHAAAFRAVAAREAESGRHDDAVDILRVLAFLRPDQAQNWDALARQLSRAGNTVGEEAAARIAERVRIRGGAS